MITIEYMIKSFHSKETEKIWKGEFAKKLPANIQNIARRKLRMLNNTQTINDLRIPPANRLEKLKRCMESIDCQTCSEFDLVISDNASTDGTREYLEGLEGRPHLSINFAVANFGLIANLEKCLEMAHALWVIFVTDDDFPPAGSFCYFSDKA